MSRTSLRSMPRAWTLRKLTELDFLLQRDVRVPQKPTTSASPTQSNSKRLHEWVEDCRVLEPEAARLAELTIRSEGLLRVSLCLFAILAGISIASGLLRYEGTRLINIGGFLGVVIGGQILLLMMMGLGQLFSRRPLAYVDRWVIPKSIQHLSSSLSLPVWGWRVFTTFQLSGICANLGILLGLFWHVLTRDLAFGWATTLETGPETVHRIVSSLSMPWGGEWTPSLEQIENSRIRVSQGISELPADATSSWWPFLLMCILFYGILPRVLLAVGGNWRFQSLLRNPRFDSPASERLLQRLTRKPLGFESHKNAEQPHADLETNAIFPAYSPSGPVHLQVETGVLPEDSLASFRRVLETKLSLTFSDTAETASGVLMVVEAWMPPLEETLHQLRETRTQVGPNGDILLLLIGIPGLQGDLPDPPEEADVETWQKRLLALEDPHLGVLRWPGGQA